MSAGAPSPARGALSRAFDVIAERMRWSALGKRLAHGTAWSAVGATASRASLLVCGVVIARHVGKEQYGAFGVVQGTVATFQIFAGFGMGLAATKHVAELRLADPRRTGRVVALLGAFTAATGALAAALLFAAAPWLAERALASPELAGPLRLGAGMLFFGALVGAHSGALAGFEAFGPLARANVIASLATLPIVIGGVYAWGLDGAVLGLVLATAVNGFLVWRALRLTARARSVPIRLRGSLAEMRAVWGFGLPALLAGALVAPVNWVCAAMLVNRPDGYAEMGIYNAANQWRLALLHLPAVLGQVVTPMLAERIGARDTDSSRGLLFLAIKINAALTLPALALISLVPSFVLGLYGSEFQGGSATLIVAVGVGALMAIQSPVGNVIVAMGRMWTAFFMNLGWGVATVLLTWAALPLGAFGLALAQLGGYLVHSIWTFGFAYRVMPRKGSAAPVERGRVT